MKRLSVLALGCLLAAAPVAWGVLFFTSFESCKYKPGPLVGQDGWVGLVANDAAEVVSGRKKARFGRRAVECWAGDLEQLTGEWSWLYDGAWEKPIEFDAVTNPAVVRVQADVKLVGPSTDEPNVPPSWDDLASANLMGRNGSKRSAWFMLSSNGHAYANSFVEDPTAQDGYKQHSYKFETPIKFGKYNRLVILMNYKTHLATFRVNGKKIGELPFGGSGEQFQSVLLECAAWNDTSGGFDHKLYTAYWDNVLVFARPAF